MPESTCPKHDDYKPILVAIAIGDTRVYDPVQVDEARRHAADCDFCRRELEAYQATVAALTPPPIPNEDELVAEIAENVRRNVLARLDAWERRRRGLRWAGALAAVAALAIAMVALWPGRAEGPARQTRQVEAPLSGPVPSTPAPKKAAPPPQPPAKRQLSRQERIRMLVRASQALGDADRRLREAPGELPVSAMREAEQKARALIVAAPGTQEARHARYCLFRCLELAGERAQAEVEFEAYIEAVAAAQGKDAACKALDEEGRRQRQRKTYTLARKRFLTILAYKNKGRTAAMAYVGIGSCYAATHQAQATERAFRKAIEFGLPAREAGRCYRYLINGAISRGEFDRARRDTAALLALPTSPSQKAADETRLGFAIERSAGRVAAIKYYRAIINKYPEDHCRLAKWRLRRLVARLDAEILAPLPGEPGGPKR